MEQQIEASTPLPSFFPFFHEIIILKKVYISVPESSLLHSLTSLADQVKSINRKEGFTFYKKPAPLVSNIVGRNKPSEAGFSNGAEQNTLHPGNSGLH